MKNDKQGARSYPLLVTRARTLPEGWEKSVIQCWEHGGEMETEYDKPGDPPSRDCTMVIEISEPLAEPRIHRAFPAGLDDLEVYRQEVLYGVHDHWIKPEEGKWKYTYHERLFDYRIRAGEGAIDQIQLLVNKLAQTPFSRRAQAVTWKCWTDPQCDDPPCLQRLWFRIVNNELHLNAHLRSNDAYKAAFMNMFAFVELQRTVADKISEQTSLPVSVGPYIHIADSYHIYGSYYEDFEFFLKSVKQRSFQERTWTSSFAQPFFDEGKKRLAREK
jgi:thymidylate synthase